MAESTDKKTRKIAEKRVEPGKEFEGYQEAQNQLLAIQAEQQQNLALQANDAMNVQQQNQTLAQASEVMAMDDLNPTTHGILAGYGLNQPRVIKQSNTQKQGPNNITINNTTINNAAGPVQGREISIKPQEAGQSKFKAWLTNVFARQDAQWQKQNQEYSRRESSLTRNANKMMRKLEGLGKEIGNVVDPRKQAQRAQNSTMNLLKALGLVYFAKKLPKILNFFNNAEEKIRGWIGSIGDKIKDGLDNIKVDLSELGDKIWNDRETGYLNKILQKISDFIFERAEYASRQTGSLTNWAKLPDGDKIITWLKLFLGGPKGGVKIQKGKIESQLYNDNNVISETTENYLNTDSRMGVDRTKDRIRLSSDNMYGVSSATGKTEISEDEYKNWLKKNDKEASEQTAKEFLDEKDFIYTGEAVILMEKVYKNPAHVLNKTQDFFAGRLRTDSIYGSIAASHDLISEVRRGYGSQGVNKNHVQDESGYTGGYDETRNTSMKAIMYYLDLLYQRALVGGSVIFEDAFNLITNTSLRKSLLESENAKKITVILIKQPMNNVDKRRYWKKGTMGLSNYYKKLVRTDHEDIDMDKALPLKEKDFKGNINPFKNQWTFYSISREGFGEIIESMTGNGVDNIFSEQSQINAANYINRNAVDFKEGNESLHYTKYNWGAYETAIEEVNDYNREKAVYEEEKDLKKLGEIKYNSKSTYNISDTKASITPEGTINDIQSINISAEQKKKNMDEVYNFFKSKGFSDEQIAGIMGVLGVESAGTFDPRIVNVDEVRKYGIDAAGEGIAQWSAGKGWSRKTPFKTWWEKQHHGKEWKGIRNISLQDQLNYLMHEWQTSHKYSYDEINKLKNDRSLTPDKIIEKTTDYFTRGFENGNNKALADYSLWGGGPNSRYKHPYSKTLKARMNNASGIYNSFIKKGNPTTTTQGDTTTAANTKNASRNQPTSTVADNVRDNTNTTTVTPTITPTIETPTNTQTVSQSLAMAENITPTERENRSPENNNEILLARCAEGIDYIAKTMAPLSEVINSGNMMVAEAVSKSGGPTNLTPQEPQLEMNRV